jgi:hypothetical protein
MQVAKIQTGLQPYETGLINSIKTALSGLSIADATDKQLAEKMAMIYLLVGLRKQHFPVDIENFLIFSYLRTEYGHKTLDELGLAFNLAIKGELDLKPEDVKVYDQFTVLYLANIMEAYRKWLLKQNQTIPEKRLELPAAVEVDPKESIHYAREVFLATKNHLLIPENLWKILKAEISLKEEDYQNYLRQAKIEFDRLYREDKHMTRETTEKEWIKRIARQLAMAKYFLTDK